MKTVLSKRNHSFFFRENVLLKTICNHSRKKITVSFVSLLTLFCTHLLAQPAVNFDPISVSTIAGDEASGSANGTGPSARFYLPANMVFDKVSGCIYICDWFNNRIRKMTTDGVVTTYAGTGASGHVDGAAASARFNRPYGIAVDRIGNVYVTDAERYLRKISTTGTVITLAGNGTMGYADGVGTSAKFDGLLGIALDTFNNIFAVDSRNNRIRKITPAGAVSTFAGDGTPNSYDGKGTNSGIWSAHDIVMTFSQNLYVITSYTNMQKITTDTVVTTIPLSSMETLPDGSSDLYGFQLGITSDSLENLYLTIFDSGIDYLVRKVTPQHVASRLAGSEGLFADGIGRAARFSFLHGITRDDNGNLYVADSNRIRKMSVPKLNLFTTAQGIASASQFFRISGNNLSGNVNIVPPTGFEVSLSQNSGYASSLSLPAIAEERPSVIVYIRLQGTAPAGIYSGNVSLSSASATTKYLPVSGNVFGPALQFDPIVVTTLAGSSGGFADGAGAAAMFNAPRGVSADASGNILVADQGNNRIRKITPAGAVTTIAGNGTPGLVNGTGATVQFNQPTGVTVDGSNNAYVSDNGNNLIRKITSAGVVSSFAGSSKGFANGAGNTAKFNSLQGVGIDKDGNIYVADANNNRIRKITPAGVVTTIAGNAAGFVNDTGTLAAFRRPFGTAVDRAGNIYVADIDNNCIRKITPDFAVSTFAGGAKGYSDGIGTFVRFNQPNSVAVDTAGNVYVADAGNSVIRKITPKGNVSTLVGWGIGFRDSVASLARFNQPKGITIDAFGDLYVADVNNNRIRKLAKAVMKPFATVRGTGSAPQVFGISGTYLSGYVTVSAPTGFEIATSSAGEYSNTMSIGTLYGELTTFTIYVRLSRYALSGFYNGNVTVSSPGAATISLPVTGTISAAPFAFANVDKKVTVFPNPNKGSFSIQLNNLNTDGARIKISDASGKIVMDKTMKGSVKSQTIPVTVQRNGTGIYFIQITSKDGIFEEKVLIE